MAFDHSLSASQSDPSVVRIDSSLISTGPHFGAQRSASGPIAVLPSPPVDFNVIQFSPSPAPESNTAIHNSDTDPNPNAANTNVDVDPQILEALKNKDRIYVLKLGETFEALIKERRTRVEVTHATSYQRLLVHRCSAYYKLQPESDPATKALFVILTAESRIPERRICDLVPAEPPTHPAFRIMKRDPRSKPQSHTGSVAGDDADLSDVEPSEAGSLGGQSYNTTSSTKKRMTIEEREAAYNEARSRIFMDFEDKDKGKDLSASSSALSVSGSTSSNGRSYMGDTDDAVSSPATESEWSMPLNTFPREPMRDGRRGGAASATSRNLRSGGSFHGNGSGSSSRNSRAASPSFAYPTIYEPTPPPAGQVYDVAHHGSNPGYHPNQYAYPYPSNSGPNPPFMPPYPYYAPPYPFQSAPPVAQHNPSDSSSPTGREPFPPHQMNYVPPYIWGPHSNPPTSQSGPHNVHAPMLPHQQNGLPQTGPMPAVPSHSPPYPPYMPPPPNFSYPMNQYYPTAPIPGQQVVQGPPPSQIMQPQPHPGYDPRNTNPNLMMRPPETFFNNQQQQQYPQFNINSHAHTGPRNGLGNGIIQPNQNVRPMANRSGSGGPGNANNGNGTRRGVPPPVVPRASWSFGPGVSMSSFPYPGGGSSPGDPVGPRFNHSNRRASGNTSSGGNSRASSTNCDDVSSIASSSTTSSSSRRTYTSTTSSQQHPLPPRPDWAVGLKAQPTLTGRHHDHSLNNSRNMSPISHSKSNGQNSPGNGNSSRQPASSQQPPTSLHATDFPPLTSGAAQERRAPVATGAWAASRPTLSPVVNGSLMGPQNVKGEESGNEFRTVGKLGEFYTPKLARRPTASSPGNQGARLPPPQLSKDLKTEPTLLAGQLAAMTVAEELSDVDSPSIPTTITANASAIVPGVPSGTTSATA